MPYDPNRVMTFDQKLRKAARAALSECGRTIVADIRERLSIPVERVRGHVFRSEPGEHPRLDTGKLRKSIKYKVAPQADRVSDLTIFSTDPKAPLLEYGTSRMEERPFLGPAAVRWKVGLPRMFKRLLAENLRKNQPGGTPAEDESE